MTSSNIRRFNDLDKRKLDIEDIDLKVDWTNEPFRIKHLKISDEAKENCDENSLPIVICKKP